MENNVTSLGNRREFTEKTGELYETQVLQWMYNTGVVGATWKDFARAFDMHHGQASGALSRLHQRRKIARLDERRERCLVYVHPDFVDGRNTTDGRAPRLVDEVAEVLRDCPQELMVWADQEWKDRRRAVLDKYLERRL